MRRGAGQVSCSTYAAATARTPASTTPMSVLGEHRPAGPSARPRSPTAAVRAFVETQAELEPGFRRARPRSDANPETGRRGGADRRADQPGPALFRRRRCARVRGQGMIRCRPATWAFCAARSPTRRSSPPNSPLSGAAKQTPTVPLSALQGERRGAAPSLTPFPRSRGREGWGWRG